MLLEALKRLGAPIVETSTVGKDSLAVGVGTSPYAGLGASFLEVPADPTESSRTRYLFLLATVLIGAGETFVMTGIRQYHSIGVVRRVDDDEAAAGVLYEREILSPMWKLPGGNVSWHVRYLPGPQISRRVSMSGRGATSTTLGETPRLLAADSSPYEPPNGGRPPGDMVGTLPDIFDVRAPWADAYVRPYETIVPGPGRVSFYASVFQPDSYEYPTLTVNQLAVLSPEDRFAATYDGSKYIRIAGAILGAKVPSSDLERCLTR